MECGHALGPGFIRVELDVIPHRVRRKEAEDRAGGQQPLVDDLRQKAPRVVEKLPGLLAEAAIMEYGRVLTAQLPGVEQRAPVDERFNPVERNLERRHSQPCRPIDCRGGPVDSQPAGTRFLDAPERLDVARSVLSAQSLEIGSGLLLELGAFVVAEQGADHSDSPRGVEHVDGGARIAWSNLDRCM